MKILWKNIIWNHTKRYWLLIKYYWNNEHLSKFSSYYYPYKRFYTLRKRRRFEGKLKSLIKETINEQNN